MSLLKSFFIDTIKFVIKFIDDILVHFIELGVHALSDITDFLIHYIVYTLFHIN